MSEKGFFCSVKPQPELFNNYLSFSDLAHAEGFEKAWKAQDVKAVEAILFKHGADTSFGWEINVVNHRPRVSNQPVYGPRFEYKSRRDHEWALTGLITIEEMIDDCDDYLLRTEMRMISQRDNNTQTIIENMAHLEDFEDEVKQDKDKK